MSPVALSTLLTVAAAASGAVAQYTSFTSIPLVNKQYAYPTGIPYQVEPTGDIRGNQVGYNVCNSTTQNQESMCQTLMVNSIDNFCLWSSPKPGETIADTEAEEVAWCTNKGYGTRMVPEGTLHGVSVFNTPDYTMFIAYLDQSQINLLANDSGGELDPHGADLLGNPMGALVYSNAFPRGNTNNDSYTQVVEWVQFIGNGEMCIKICNPTTATADNVGLCNNIYDEIGIDYNCPNPAKNGTFVVCDADSMNPVGVYTSNGQTLTYTQPASGVVTSMPYTPTVPATSNCKTYQSTDLYTQLVAATPTGSGSSTGTASGHSATGTASGSKASGTAGASSSAGASSANGANALHISAVASIAGVLFAGYFLS
ncbi:hypothetical protein BKA93DRAFT_739117 [Sparassis latifolia]|uniref:Macrofage activating glycoprotein n=1 Tax=Sparassis crispa TaxID=139825 RepID=A0A401H141_9APHY|nr:hypothetical protein SCP_1203430 [Sparassis crispa]GBE88113.1 hypothetical protein SCP_1203430 [Sparassis crispa]